MGLVRVSVALSVALVLGSCSGSGNAKESAARTTSTIAEQRTTAGSIPSAPSTVVSTEADRFDAGTESASVEDPSHSRAIASALALEEDAELRCFGEALEPPDDFEIVLDAVALPTSAAYPAALQTAARIGDDGSTYYFAKTGLYFQADGPGFELSVPDEFRSALAMGWGGPAPSAQHITMTCDATIPGWRVLPGGFWVTEPMCASLLVSSGGAERSISIGLGRPCAGQTPPPEPSDG